MKRNASEFASSATQPHLVPTLWSQLMVPTLCSQHRFHFWRTPVPPSAPNLWSQLSGPNSQVRTLWPHLRQTPNAPPVPTLCSEFFGPNSPVRALWPRLRQTPHAPLVPILWPQRLVPTLRPQLSRLIFGGLHALGPNSWSELSDPNSGGLPLHPRSQLLILSLPSHLLFPTLPTLWLQLCQLSGAYCPVPSPTPGPNSPDSLVPSLRTHGHMVQYERELSRQCGHAL